MYKHCHSVAGTLAVAAAALLFNPGPVLAQHHGGGGGHSGGSHGGGGGHSGGSFHGGGGGYRGGYHNGGYRGGYHAGSSYYRGGDGYRRYDRNYGYRHYGLGFGLGLGYPWYYGGYSYPWYYGGYSNYYEPNYYYSYPSYDYYSTPSYAYSSTPTYEYAPAYGSENSDANSFPAAPDNVAHVTVDVPANAVVWFGNQQTTQQGTERHFNSPPLDLGRNFTYTIRAQWQNDEGQNVTQTRQVEVKAGAQVVVNFLNTPPQG